MNLLEDTHRIPNPKNTGSFVNSRINKSIFFRFWVLRSSYRSYGSCLIWSPNHFNHPATIGPALLRAFILAPSFGLSHKPLKSRSQTLWDRVSMCHNVTMSQCVNVTSCDKLSFKVARVTRICHNHRIPAVSTQLNFRGRICQMDFSCIGWLKWWFVCWSG